jgi:hypothetical protein
MKKRTRASSARLFAGTLVFVGGLWTSSFVGTALVQSAFTSPAGASVTSVKICGVEGRVTAFGILRGSVRNPTTFSFPKSVYVNNATSSRSVARALCALPEPSAGVLNCPSDQGPNYTLTFVAPGYQMTKVVVDPTGCGTVTGMTTDRTVSRSPGFWPILGAAMKIKGATNETFRGREKS